MIWNTIRNVEQFNRKVGINSRLQNEMVKIVRRKSMLRQKMRALSMVLALVMLCLTTNCFVFAAEEKPVASSHNSVQEISECKGSICYFENSEAWTVNAVALDNETINVSIAFCEEKGIVYSIDVNYCELLNGRSLREISTWEEICCIAKANLGNAEIITYQTKSIYMNGTTRMNTSGVLLQDLENLYGDAYTLSLVANLHSSDILVTIKKSLSYEMIPIGEEVINSSDTTLSAFATAVRISAAQLGTFWGMLVSDLMPREAVFYKYTGIAYFDRFGMVSGQTYYVTVKECWHVGVDCVSDPTFEPYLSTTPDRVIYSDRESYDNVVVHAARTVAVYNG